MMLRLMMRSMRCDRSWNEEFRIVNGELGRGDSLRDSKAERLDCRFDQIDLPSPKINI